MYKIKLLALLFVLSLGSFSCKKDKIATKAFENITLADVTANEAKFSFQAIPVKSFNGFNLKVGSIFFYKTSLGTYGKMKLVAVNKANEGWFDITIDVYNFKPDGTMLLDKKGVVIHNTYFCDLDTGQEINQSNISEFFFTSDGTVSQEYFSCAIQPIFNAGGFWVYAN